MEIAKRYGKIYTQGDKLGLRLVWEEIITADGKKLKLNDEHIKELVAKGKRQNNKLCFADITDMIAALENFTPKDYEKVMAAVNKASIELVDKLSKEDLEEVIQEKLNEALAEKKEQVAQKAEEKFMNWLQKKLEEWLQKNCGGC